MSLPEQGEPAGFRTSRPPGQEMERLDRILRESQSLAKVGGWEIDMETGLHHWTEETFRIHECNPAEYSPSMESAIGFYVPEAKPVIREAFRKLLEDGCSYELDLEMITAKGHRIWVNTMGCTEMVRGRIVRLYGCIQDITKRKRNEEALRDSEGKFTKVYHLSPDAINLTHLGSNRFLEVNLSHEKIFGYSREELLGHSPLPGDLDLWANIEDRDRFIARLKKSGEVKEFLTLMKRKNGDIFDAIISSSLIEVLGEPYILSITRDISKRKQMEEALLASEEKFSKTFRSAPLLAALSLMDNGQLIDVNDLYCQTLGFTRGELIGKNTTELGIVRPNDREKLINIVESKGSAKNIELEMYARSGQMIPCLFSGETVSVGKQHMLISMVTDITELKRKEEHDRLLGAQLQQAHKMESLGALVAGVSHNINNVLAIIMGTASLREQSAIDPSDVKAYKTIGRACARGRDVVRSLVQFAKPTISNQAPFELHMLIQELCTLLENTTSNRIKIIETFVDEPLWINGDAGTFNHALLNLSINSIDAMPNGGTLTFETSILKGNWVEVSVEDDGEGIAHDILAKVMEPFLALR